MSDEKTDAGRESGGVPLPVRWLTHSFPLRPDFTASLIVPYDLTSEECERIVRLINAIATPTEKQPS